MPPKDTAAATEKPTTETVDKAAAPVADKAPVTQDKAPASDKATDKPVEGEAADTDKLPDDTDGAETGSDGDGEEGETDEGEGEESEGGPGILDDEDDDTGKAGDKKAADKDAKAKAKDDGKAKPAADWTTKRDGIVKAAEQKLLKKAKTEDEKKAATTQLDRLKKQLSRYGTEEAAILAGMEAQEKLRAGQEKKKPGKDAPPEEVAAWREAVGLPPEAKSYDIPKIAGHQWTDADKPLHTSFKDAAFKADLTQAQVNALTEWQVAYGAESKAAKDAAIKDIDKVEKKEARAALMEEFGDEFTPRLEIVDRLLKDDEALPGGAGKMIWDARTPEGRALRHHPVILKILSEIAMNGFGDWGGYGEGSLKTGDVREADSTRKKQLQEIMRTDRDKYYRDNLDAEYRKILEGEEKSAGRGRRAA